MLCPVLAPTSFDDSLFVDSVAEAVELGWASIADEDAVPSDAILIRVVVASAGRERVEAPTFLVSRREGFRWCLGEASCDTGKEVRLEATFWAAEMLSRATSVTGAALDDMETGQAPGYQFYENNPSISYQRIQTQRQ
ncbi:hypothetical protein BDV40DRAFT_72151 [Aspergillus tamarii]|uniref:Uncharacterized protein n=1 Tax=Aspergillus tamarii TaxID=41984 RepID=A0A5N6V2W8_ASPTM|nr:hypothetical protein BDV40DRAFT_72151 [Aspergillus tamarii]